MASTWRTPAMAISRTLSLGICSFFIMWIGEVLMKTWMREWAAFFMASAARSRR